jgi:hypothetical protein
MFGKKGVDMKLLLSLAIFFLSSCAATPERQIRQKLAMEGTVHDGTSMRENVLSAINDSRTLSTQQKSVLNKILSKVSNENKELSARSFKLRAILIKELIKQDVDQQEVWQLKRDISQAERKRLKNTLRAMSDVSKTVGNDPETDWYMEHAFMP